ncbi:MAG: hypothetical protein AVDCRST_MAG13-1411, partial [uncultured Solirubrobacteraceae bacterium]
ERRGSAPAEGPDPRAVRRGEPPHGRRRLLAAGRHGHACPVRHGGRPARQRDLGLGGAVPGLRRSPDARPEGGRRPVRRARGLRGARAAEAPADRGGL